MKKLSNSRCVFYCPKLNLKTNSLKKAVEWDKKGFIVYFQMDNVDIGIVHYAGTCNKVEELPESDECGNVYLCNEDNSLCISLSDNILEMLED